MRQALLVLLLLAPLGARAQYALDQPRALAGLEAVRLVFEDPANLFTPAERATVVQALALELRRTGLRVNDTSPALPLDGTEGTLNVGVYAFGNWTTSDVLGRIDLEQNVIIPRLEQELQLVTWFYENQQRSSNKAKEHAGQIINAGMRQFLSDWLSANDR